MPRYPMTNYVEVIPGSTVTAHLGENRNNPSEWFYSLWEEDDSVIASGRINFAPLAVTPQQVARVAFLLEVEYGDA